MKNRVIIHRKPMDKYMRRNTPDADVPGPSHQIISVLDQKTTAVNEYVLTKDDIRALKRLARDYERTIDYYYLRNKPGRNILVGLVNGMARGLGIAIGITVLAFIVYYILKSLQVLDLPFIGNFIADLLDYIEDVRNISI